MHTVLAGTAFLFLAAGQAGAAAPIEGLWRSPGGNSIIGIAPCGDALCGTVKWASAKAIKDARKGTDQLVGSALLTGLQQKKPGEWQGKLFVPDQKLRVKAKIWMQGDEQLKVSGCAVGICKTQLWTRTGEPLPASD